MGNLENKEFISDTLVTERALYESVQDKKSSKSGILRTIKGPVAEYVKPNRNNRVYSENLWDKVLESPYVKEQLKYKTLYGELNHPTERYEVDFTRVSHSITEMWKVPASDQIFATINILNTPSGQILNTLYEAGGVIGYSSRAGGTLHQKKDYIEVDEKTYNFITFDAVPFPSVKAARPDDLVTEGVEHDVASLNDEVHEKLCKIILESGISNREAIKDLIYGIEYFDMSKEKALLESMDINNVVENNSTSESTMTLLKESSIKIDELSASNQILESDNTRLKAENEVLKRSLDDSVKKLADAISESKMIEGKKSFDKRKADDTIRELELANEELKSRLEDSELINEEVSDLRGIVKILKDENRGLKASASNEDVNALKRELNEAYEEMSRLISELDESKAEISKLNESIEDMTSVIDDVSIRLEESESKVSKLKSDKTELVNESKVFDERLTDSNATIKQLNSEIADLNSKIKVLEANVLEKSEEVKVVENTQYRDDLVSVICSGYNLDVNDVLKHLKEGFTKSDVYCVCEGISNSKKNGVSYNTIADSFNSEVTDSITPKSNANSKLNYIYSTTATNRRGVGVI